MYNRITFNYDGIITKGILLAECDFIETISVPVEKKFLFFKYYSKGTDKRKFKMYIVLSLGNTHWKILFLLVKDKF